MFTGTPGHLQTFNYLGEYRYFLTFCTYQRHRAFIDGDKVEVVSTQVLRAAAEERFALTAYCYMPDHLHLLAEGRVATSTAEDSLLARSSFRGSTTRGRSPSGCGNGTAYERVLRADEETLSVARYILENPIRAGLVRNVRDYPFIGSNVYTVSEMLDGLNMSG